MFIKQLCGFNPSDSDKPANQTTPCGFGKSLLFLCALCIRWLVGVMLSNYIGSSLSLGMSPSAVVPRLSDGLQAGDVLDSIYPPCDYIPYSADPLDEDREGDRCSINAFSSLSLCLMQTHAELCNLTCVSFDLATNLSVPFVSVKLASVYCFSDSLMRAHPN